MPELTITDDARTYIERFTQKAVDGAEAGSVTKADWEHARSDAVEALQAILNANEQAFDYRPRLDAIAEKRRLNGRQAQPSTSGGSR
jgi:hypothetical protein